MWLRRRHFQVSGADLNPFSSSSLILILSSNCTFDTIVVLVVMFITYATLKITELNWTEQASFSLLWPWPWPGDLHIRTWPKDSEDVPAYQNELSIGQGFQKLDHYSRQTDRQTDRYHQIFNKTTERPDTQTGATKTLPRCIRVEWSGMKWNLIKI